MEYPVILLTRTEIGIAAQPFLNEALTEDQLESGRVCDRNSYFATAKHVPDSANLDLRRSR